MDEIKEKLIKHDYAIEQLSRAISELASNTKNTNSKLEAIVESIGKQELILERLSNLDSKYKDSLERIYARIESIENYIGWFNKSIIGAIIAGSIGILFFAIKH